MADPLGLQPALWAPDEVRLAWFDQELNALRTQYRIPGLSATVVRSQQIIWEQGFGFQDLERRIPATRDRLYQIASLTKTFTSQAQQGTRVPLSR